MGLLNLLKQNLKKIPTQKQQVTLKVIPVTLNKKSINNLYIGKFLSIDINDKDDNENYYFSIYKYNNETKQTDYIKVSNKISDEFSEYCEKYNYAIIYQIGEKIMNVAIICSYGYLQRIKVEMFKHFNNGEAFIIKDGLLYNNNERVGKIIDDRTFDYDNILMGSLEEDVYVCFFKK